MSAHRYACTRSALLIVGLVFTMIITLLKFLSPAWAKDPIEKAVIELEYKGIAGAWFRFDAAQDMLKRLEAADALAKDRKLLEQQATMLAATVTKQQALITEMEGTLAKLSARAAQQTARLEAVENSKSTAWLWSSIGFVAGTAMTVGVALIIK